MNINFDFKEFKKIHPHAMDEIYVARRGFLAAIFGGAGFFLAISDSEDFLVFLLVHLIALILMVIGTFFLWSVGGFEEEE